MPKRDPLFAEEEWYQQPLFSTLRTHYRMWREHAEKIMHMWSRQAHVNEFGMQAVQFYFDAMAPSHIPFLHPVVLRTTLEERGDNLQRGMKRWIEHLRQHIEEQKPFFLPPLGQFENFKVGENVASTSGHVIWQDDLFQLIRYTPTQTKVYARPLLIVPPWINKYYILDLSSHNSFVRWCVEQSLDVYLISWVNPTKAYAHYDLCAYVQAIIAVVQHVQQLVQQAPHVMGYCVGGVGSVLAAACARKKDIGGLTLLTTPIDFTRMEPFSSWMNERTVMGLSDAMKHGDGVILGCWFNLLFSLMRPHDMIWKNSINQYFLGKPAPEMDFLFWNNDSINVVTKLHTDYLEYFFRNNIFVKGDFYFLGKKRNVSRINIPMFVLNTKRDHIVPFQASFPAAEKLWPHAVRVLADAGHVAGVINPPSQTKYGFSVDESHHSHSWWLYWIEWMQKHMGPLRDAEKTPESQIIEPAPGRYVRCVHSCKALSHDVVS